MSANPAAIAAPSPARTETDSVSLPAMRRSLDQYANCTPAAVSGGSRAQMHFFVEDAKHDIAALVEALREVFKSASNTFEAYREVELRALAAESKLKEIASIGSKITDPCNVYGIQMTNIAGSFRTGSAT